MLQAPRRVSLAWITSVLPEAYLLIALLIAIPISVLTPPFLVSDEGAHTERAISIAHGDWLAETTPAGVGAPIDTHLVQVISDFRRIQEDMALRYPIARTRPFGRIPISIFTTDEKIYWSHQLVFTAFDNTAAYPATLYLPQIVGWRVAEALNLSIIHSLMAVRWFTALCSILIGWLALRICRCNRWLLGAYLLLPTVLGQAASISQDALLVTIVALFAAILSRAIAERRSVTYAELFVSALLSSAFTIARPPYLLLALCLLLPSLALPGFHWRRLLAPALTFLAVAASLIVWQKAMPASDLYQHIAPGADPKLQLAYLASHPLLGVWCILKGTVLLGPHMGIKALYTLGWNDIYPSNEVYLALILGLAGLCLASTWRGLPNGRTRALLFFAVTSSVLAVSVAEYLIWTPVGDPVLTGLLGRYYVIYLPFLALLSSESLRPWRRASTQRVLLATSALLVLAVMLTIPFVTVRSYYNLSPARFIASAFR